MTERARFLVRWVVVQPHESEPFLILEQQLDCPACGHGLLRLAGHHVAALGEALDQVRRDHPDLLAPGKDARWTSENYSFGGPGDTDPSQN